MRLVHLLVAVTLGWTLPAIGGEPPPGWYQDIPNGPIDVGGTQVSGHLDAVSVGDIVQASKEFKVDGFKEPVLNVISKDEIQGYGPNRDLGWLTAKRTAYVWPDKSEHPGWIVWGQGLPEDKKALECIHYAQQVYVFPVATPDDPHRDDAHMRLLDGDARSQIIDTFGSDDSWENALDSMRSSPSAPGVGFVFKHGDDELVLFPYGRLKAVGTFNGEHISGLLTEGSAQKFKDWKVKYAQPELGAQKR